MLIHVKFRKFEVRECIKGGRAQMLSIMGTEDLHRTTGPHFLEEISPYATHTLNAHFFGLDLLLA